MCINQVFEFSMVLDNEKFHKILYKVISREGYLEEAEEGYLDQSLASKGIIVKYRDSQYKKKIKLIVNPRVVLDCDTRDPDRIIRKLDKRVSKYFGYKYRIDDFDLSGMILSTDIHVGGREDVSAYLKVLQRIGKTKGFSPSVYEGIDVSSSFCLDGNSNGISFLIYDLERTMIDQHENFDFNRKSLKSMIKNSEGILHTEVRLTKPKAIRSYTDRTETSAQFADLLHKSNEIFLDTFIRIIPFGAYYKKDKAEEIIRSEVEDSRLRSKMLHLLTLIPEKKSLYLAQKAMNCRNIEKVMDGFAKINLSPVTLSKRQDVKHLKCLYDFLVDKK